MQTQVIGNAQLFMVVKDLKTEQCVGMNIVVSDPVLLVDYLSSGLLPGLTLSGTLLESTTVDLPDDFEKAPECTYEFIPDKNPDEESLNE